MSNYLLQILKDYLRGRSLFYETLETHRRTETEDVGSSIGVNLRAGPLERVALGQTALRHLSLNALLMNKRMDDSLSFQLYAEKILSSYLYQKENLTLFSYQLVS